MKENQILCCYCGVRIASTKDHIPPKGIFNKPRANDLITVPCCFECNNGSSKNDEIFKVFLGMHVARFGGEGERLYKQAVLPTTRHNKRLKAHIVQNTQSTQLVNKDGVITEKSFAVTWDSEAHDLTIEKVVRGLFYHHYAKVIPANVPIKTYWFYELPDQLDSSLYTVSIANGAFVYKYNKVDDEEYASCWMFSFYKGHFAAGLIDVREE